MSGHATRHHHRSLLEIHITHSTVSMFTNPKRFVDPLQTIELDEQRSTTCHENEAEEQRTKRETRSDLHIAVQSSFDLGIGLLGWGFRGILSWRLFNFRDIKPSVFLQGNRRAILLVTFDFTEGTQKLRAQRG